MQQKSVRNPHVLNGVWAGGTYLVLCIIISKLLQHHGCNHKLSGAELLIVIEKNATEMVLCLCDDVVEGCVCGNGKSQKGVYAYGE